MRKPLLSRRPTALAIALCLTGYAGAQDFTCGELLLDTRDGREYATIAIGSQCWMQQNLDFGTYITHATPQADNSVAEKYCYNDVEGNCGFYGGLYRWPEAMQHATAEGVQGVCPEGWHLPTDGEWKDLEMFFGMSQAAADSIGFRGTDQAAQMILGGGSGFDILYGGVLNGMQNDFGGIDHYSLLWTSTLDSGNNYPFRRGFYDDDTRVYRGSGSIPQSPQYGYAVRCLFNSPVSVPQPEGAVDLQVYPNPATDLLFVTADLAPGNRTYQLLDMLGRPVRSWTANKAACTVDVSDVPRGFYLLQAYSATGTVVFSAKVELVNSY